MTYPSQGSLYRRSGGLPSGRSRTFSSWFPTQPVPRGTKKSQGPQGWLFTRNWRDCHEQQRHLTEIVHEQNRNIRGHSRTWSALFPQGVVVVVVVVVAVAVAVAVVVIVSSSSSSTTTSSSCTTTNHYDYYYYDYYYYYIYYVILLWL